LNRQRREIRFKEHIIDKRFELVVPLLLEELDHRGWDFPVFECLVQTSGRLIRPKQEVAVGSKRKWHESK
jgi:hypothetical protein